MRKARFLCMVFLVAGLLSGCKKAGDSAGPDGSNTTGSKLVDKVIDASVQDVTVSVQGKINVVIPKGMAPANTTITIEKIDAAGLPKDDKFTIMDVYEVKLSSGSSFSTPLKVTINYDASKAPTGKFRNKMGAAYLDETAKIWRVFSDCVVDTINKTMTFPTNHLTKLSTWGWTSNTSVYTDYYSTTHFNIYWQAGKIYTNTEYKTPFPRAGSDPDYIKDIGKYLEEAYDAYKLLGLTVPTLVKVDVYLTSTLDAGVDGQTQFLGYLYLNNKIKGDGTTLSIEKMVPLVCAHEFLHYVQDYYYVQLFSDYTTKWWFEATATQADRMVWPKSTNFESLLYADKVKGIMDKSWDDCNADPDWYTAGCFLAYLSAYRSGNKASIAELIKQGGSNTSISNMRTVVDTYLKSTLSLSSLGIGTEYLNYIRWAFESTGDIKIASTPPSQKQSNDAYVRTFFAPLTESTKETNESFPRLSVRSIKIYHDLNVDAKGDYGKGITITAKDLPNEVFAYVYTMERVAQVNTIKLVQQLKKLDVVKLTLPKGSSKWIEVLLVNTSKDDAKNYIIEVKSKITPTISSISPVKLYPGENLTINGTSFGDTGSTSDIYIDGIKINSSSNDVIWTDTKIVVKVPTTANTGTVYVKIKEDSSNSVNLEVDRSLPTTISGSVSNLSVTSIDQDKKTTTITSGGLGFFITGSGVVVWSGNSFSYTYTKEPDAANSYKEVETLTGTLSADHKTLLTLTYKRNDVAKLEIPGFTREMRRDWEFSISNVPIDNNYIPWLNHIKFTVTGTAFNNHNAKYSYSTSQVEIDYYTGTKSWTTKVTSFQANASTYFILNI